MANQLSALTQYAQRNGMRPIGQQDQNKDQNEWQKWLSMLLASDKINWQTAAGGVLAKLLRDGFNTWKGNYDARGFINDKLLGASPEERERMLSFLKENNPDQYNRVVGRYGDRWQTSPTGDSTQPDLSGINPNPSASQRAREGILGNPAELLGNSTPPEVPLVSSEAFAPATLDGEELRKRYNLFDAINGMGWQR